MAGRTATATRILDISERLVQMQGFNGFSYADISREIGIRKASLHYHFPTKKDLGRSLIARYHTRFVSALDAIQMGRGSSREKLSAYVSIYRSVVDADRMCLCGILAAEYKTLPKGMRTALGEFFEANENWLARFLDEGREAGQLAFSGSSLESARQLICTLEGGMLLARAQGDRSRFESLSKRLVDELTPSRKQ